MSDGLHAPEGKVWLSEWWLLFCLNKGKNPHTWWFPHHQPGSVIFSWIKSSFQRAPNSATITSPTTTSPVGWGPHQWCKRGTSFFSDSFICWIIRWLTPFVTLWFRPSHCFASSWETSQTLKWASGNCFLLCFLPHFLPRPSSFSFFIASFPFFFESFLSLPPFCQVSFLFFSLYVYLPCLLSFLCSLTPFSCFDSSSLFSCSLQLFLLCSLLLTFLLLFVSQISAPVFAMYFLTSNLPIPFSSLLSSPPFLQSFLCWAYQQIFQFSSLSPLLSCPLHLILSVLHLSPHWIVKVALAADPVHYKSCDIETSGAILSFVFFTSWNWMKWLNTGSQKLCFLPKLFKPLTSSNEDRAVWRRAINRMVYIYWKWSSWRKEQLSLLSEYDRKLVWYCLIKSIRRPCFLIWNIQIFKIQGRNEHGLKTRQIKWKEKNIESQLDQSQVPTLVADWCHWI